MRKKSTTKRFKLNPAKSPKADWSKFDAMSTKKRHAAALMDEDCPPATAAQLAKAKRMPDIKKIRLKLNLTQEQFAKQFHLSLGAVRDWEQGSHKPDRAASALLKVIAFNHKVVEQALRA